MSSADKLPAALQASEEDIQLMLSAQCHLGTKNCDKTMEPYVWKRRADGELLDLAGIIGWAYGLGIIGGNRGRLEGSWRIYEMRE